MHSCWKTVNITREYGVGRINILSAFCGVLSFILLFLPYSLLHQNTIIADHGFIPFLLLLLAIPTTHNLAHIIPLIIFNKRIKIRWSLIGGIFPILTFRPVGILSKGLAIITWLSPTLFLTLPGLAIGTYLPSYYPYILFFIAINLGISYKDFVYVGHFLKAPKKCFIEKDNEEFDILIQK